MNGICTCVTCANKPVYISDNDMISLKTMQDMDVITIRSNELIIGDKIRVIEGPLCGYEGVLVKVNGISKFGINIVHANLTAIVDVDISMIKKI